MLISLFTGMETNEDVALIEGTGVREGTTDKVLLESAQMTGGGRKKVCESQAWC